MTETRKALVRKLSRRWKCNLKTSAQRIDGVLDEVIAMVTPKLEKEWVGNSVIDTLREWRGSAP